jgi:hypothetical protein
MWFSRAWARVPRELNWRGFRLKFPPEFRPRGELKICVFKDYP